MSTFILFTLLLGLIFAPWSVFADSKNQPQEQCYRLDKAKLNGEFDSIRFFGDQQLQKKQTLQLNADGLFEDKRRICKWSLNGGSGTKDKFSLDADIAIPILNPPCEKPFSNAKTGNGFGDWELMLCGVVSKVYCAVLDLTTRPRI